MSVHYSVLIGDVVADRQSARDSNVKYLDGRCNNVW